MPAPSTLALFALAALALIAIPGPNMVYVATRSMSEGRRSGYASALGLLTGTLINVAAAAAGLSALIASSATAFNVLKYLGAAYLVYLGLRALLKRDEAAEEGAARPVSLARAYRQAIVVQLLNPKVALFFLAFLPQFVDPAARPVWHADPRAGSDPRRARASRWTAATRSPPVPRPPSSAASATASGSPARSTSRWAPPPR